MIKREVYKDGKWEVDRRKTLIVREELESVKAHRNAINKVNAAYLNGILKILGGNKQ